MSQGYCVILTTTGSQEEANHLSELLVHEKLAACVQRFPITSTYTWEGKLTRDSEWLLLIKTRSEKFKEIESLILTHHSYNVPEIIQLPVKAGNPGYLTWIDDNTA
ncbi:MAG: divalent-cation tolerance protein CutA [Brevefilum sp.]|nr:divalent-cation tolerance protein CutA [Brevefilum sp.]MDT8381558.1 divalent-cation tolerance protein CutA [Brevefilum sp.]MDW7753978.1 divalent-cation tolerance protein CutA [Brevefilum sp.]